MAEFTDHDFVEDVLVGGLGARHVAVGFDITFGKGRTGDPDLMRRYGEEFGFTRLGGRGRRRRGRQVLLHRGPRGPARGQPELAAEVLGRPFAIEGVVQKGRQLGRKLGFPTANVPLGDYVAPKFGVYATRTRLKDGRELGGVANIGVNPTTGLVEPRLEVWLFEFDEDIYGETIETDLVAFLRPEVEVPTRRAISTSRPWSTQVHEDARQAKAILGVVTNQGSPAGAGSVTSPAHDRFGQGLELTARRDAAGRDPARAGYSPTPSSRTDAGPDHGPPMPPATRRPAARDYRETVFLPDTPFPMRAGLPKKEPEILAGWAEADLYAADRARPARPPARRSSCCTTARPTPTARSTSATR